MSVTWPKAAAVAIALGLWELAVALRLKPDYVLPSPGQVLAEISREVQTSAFYRAIAITMGRAAVGYALAIVIGSVVGIAVARVPPLRSAVGSLITGLQTMPSVVWLPFAVLLFQISESAILFVVVMGAAPSIANGFIAGIDHVPPELVRAGRVLGARGLRLYRSVILPASLPALLGGLKQGWAFAWRSLMAGELIVIVAGRPSIGARIQFDRDFNDAAAMIATMIVILVIGILVDTLFSSADRRMRRQRGLLEAAT